MNPNTHHHCENCPNHGHCEHCNGKCCGHCEHCHCHDHDVGKPIEEIVPVNNCKIKMPDVCPAVTFARNFYTMDNCYPLDAPNVYTVFGAINNSIIVDSLNRTNDSNRDYETSLVREADRHNIECIVNNFDATLNNCMLCHLSNLNKMFSPEGVILVDFIKDEGSAHFTIGHNRQAYNIKNAVLTFVNSYSTAEQDSMINSNYLINSVMSFINDLGNRIYTDIRFKLNTFLANITVTEANDIKEMVDHIDHEFSLMMQDFTYEGSVFVVNLINYFNNAPITQDDRNNMMNFLNSAPENLTDLPF